MADMIVLRDKLNGYYLAEKFLKGFYMTPDISGALKCKTNEEAELKLMKQNIKPPTELQKEIVNFS